MDDAEYYKKMREQYSHNPFSKRKDYAGKFKLWENREGREDAQMLQEKKETTSSEYKASEEEE